MKKTDEQTLEQTMQELNQVIEQLQSPECPLEESFELYTKGMKLLKRCNDSIDRVEKEVIVLEEQ